LALLVNRVRSYSVYLPKLEFHPPAVKPCAYRASGLVQITK
jgi:hypothetical protein